MTNPELQVALNRDSEEPIYRQLIHGIKSQIESGQLAAGTRLPASRDLAEMMHISRISVVNAYAELRAEGYLSAHAGRGTFVAKEKGYHSPSPVHPQENGHHRPIPHVETVANYDYSLRDMMRLARRQGMINFSHGAPPPDFFPMAALRDAMNYVLDHDGPAALAYEVPEGYQPLRVAVRDYVSALGVRCTYDQILITGGAQQALDLIVQALVSEGEIILTAAPTYVGILDIARARRIRVHTIPMDEQGIRIDCLEDYLVEHNPKLIYVMPTFHNPTGFVMPLHRRRQLLNLAQEYRIPVVEDAVYHEMRFEGESVPTLKALDETGNVLHISAFTKMLLPGMRIGYLIATGGQLERLVRVKQAADISTSGFNQRVIYTLLRRGVLAQHLERLSRELRHRRDTAIKTLERYFPADTTWQKPEGGMYLWLTLPAHGPTATELFIRAAQYEVAFAIGNVFYANGGGTYQLRLNYGIQPPAKIEEGIKRLGQAWHELAHGYDTIEKSPLL